MIIIYIIYIYLYIPPLYLSLCLSLDRCGGQRRCRSALTCVTGVPRSSETAAAWDPTVGLFLGPYGSPWGVGSFL